MPRHKHTWIQVLAGPYTYACICGAKGRKNVKTHKVYEVDDYPEITARPADWPDQIIDDPWDSACHECGCVPQHCKCGR